MLLYIPFIAAIQYPESKMCLEKIPKSLNIQVENTLLKAIFNEF